ncbi:DNA-binding protein H-NS [Xanthomonas sacchari]|uniref:H-NS family nucleoid-associated regulatory protein n=1 Tax=Xanthomonas sacchari TaxID=56458 RepID=UPI0027860437|nr:H-NS family nucleoid-associated regulatory protein [Xanthomonas sacchari]MDQ1090654.1 DNA-binding protein H-NS [Xanthomonas sacchari]
MKTVAGKIFMAKITMLERIAAAKAELLEELRKLEQEESGVRQRQASQAFASIVQLLQSYGVHFSQDQKAQIATFVAPATIRRVRLTRSSNRQEVSPKYWLPHSQETWSGRGRTPRAFHAWVGTVAYNEWKKRHPNEKFPAFPG